MPSLVRYVAWLVWGALPNILGRVLGVIRTTLFEPVFILNRAKPSQTGKKPSQNKAKPEKTEPNQFEPVFILKNQTESKLVGLNWFRFFLKKINF
jgi:hypothetical protein